MSSIKSLFDWGARLALSLAILSGAATVAYAYTLCTPNNCAMTGTQCNNPGAACDGAGCECHQGARACLCKRD